MPLALHFPSLTTYTFDAKSFKKIEKLLFLELSCIYIILGRALSEISKWKMEESSKGN